MYTETNKRIIFRTITFKAITTGVTALIVGIKGAIFIHALMTVIYIAHEKIWSRINWGKKSIKK